MQGAVQILSQDKAKPLTACEQEKDMLRLPGLHSALRLPGWKDLGAETANSSGGGEQWMEPRCILFVCFLFLFFWLCQVLRDSLMAQP